MEKLKFEPIEKVTYDAHGRMNYHPEFHFKQGEPWTTKEEKFLVEMYEKLGPLEVSFSLGRTVHAVMTRAYELRKKGRMPKRSIRTNFPRNGRETYSKGV